MPTSRRLDWSRVLAIGAIHLGCVLALLPQFFTWSCIPLVLVLWFVCGCLGITTCYHRLLTHQSYETYRWVKYTLAIIGCLGLQGGPLRWVGVHRVHHSDSDGPKDPHSPKKNFLWGHMWWVFFKDGPDFKPYDMVKDLQKDRVLVFIDTWFYLFTIPFAIGLYLIGGWPWIVWGIFVRITVSYHATWVVNSLAHTIGYRNFDTKDGSTNCPLIAPITWGEGWHNNHHAFQRSAAHGLCWWEFDVTYLVIRIMKSLHLAWNIILPPIAELEKKAPTITFLHVQKST